MKKRITLFFLLFITLALVLVSAFSCYIFERKYINEMEEQLNTTLTVVSMLHQEGVNNATICTTIKTQSGEKIRVSILDLKGNIIADSVADLSTPRNDAYTQEFKDAVATGHGYNIRLSHTLGTKAMYVAALSDNTVIKLSMTINYLDEFLWQSIPFLVLIILLLLIASAIFSGKIARRIVQPFQGVSVTAQKLIDGNYDIEALDESGIVELAPVVRAINALTARLASYMRELSEEKEKIHYLLNNMDEGLLVLDESGAVLLSNRAVEDMLGEKIERGENIIFICREATLIHALESAHAQRQAMSLELGFASRPGRRYHVLINPIGEEMAEYRRGAILLFSDITEMAMAQRIRSEFTANVSHELKTPLTSIRGFAEMLRISGMDDKAKAERYLDFITLEIDRLTALINDILKISELDEISIDRGIVQTDLGAVVRQTIEQLSSFAQERGVQVSFSGAAQAEIQPERFHEIALNLLDNAIKYNRNGGQVDVTLFMENMAELRVADTGQGIPAEDQARVFERFYRVDKSRARDTGGTGLGLSIVKHIVQLYRGTIQLESQSGKGTTITVRLPIEARQK